MTNVPARLNRSPSVLFCPPQHASARTQRRVRMSTNPSAGRESRHLNHCIRLPMTTSRRACPQWCVHERMPRYTSNYTPSPISAPPGARPEQRVHNTLYSAQWQPCSRAHLSTCRCRPSAVNSHTPIAAPPDARPQRPLRNAFRSSHGQWCSRAHFSTSRCPPRAACADVR
jgi:hypothetical protein